MCGKLGYLSSLVLVLALVGHASGVGQACCPSPANGATNVVQNPTLAWTAGSGATSHDVYFDTNATNVSNATTSTPVIYKGRQTATTYNPGVLNLCSDYYWRIDEVNDLNESNKGIVWGFTTTCSGSSGCVNPPSGMVAWWPLDENSTPGGVSHDIVNYNHGIWLGSPTPVAGKVKGALSFNGSTDYVQVQDAPELNFGTGNFSIDAWVKATNTPGIRVILDKRSGTESLPRGYQLYLLTGKLGLQLADGNYTNYQSSLPSVADGNWHHVAATLDRDEPNGLKLYVDGVSQTFSPMARQGDLTNDANLLIAARCFGSSTRFNGAIDEVELFNRALSANEIQAIFESGLNGKCKDCNGNGIPDYIDIANGTSKDRNGNGIPDECELGGWRKFEMPMRRVGGGGADPNYTFRMGIYEVTNDQYAVFLNNAQLDGGTSGRGSNMVFDANGGVTIPAGDWIFRPQGDIGTASRIVYNIAASIGERYTVEPGFESYPVTAVSWFGAVKFCNWLTIDQGIDADQFCYSEGPNSVDWHPVTISTADWDTRDMNEAERQTLVDGYAGFRLPMDNLGAATNWVSNQENAYNEWYKAAAYCPNAPGGTDPGGATHSPNHTFYSTGYDTIDTNAANYELAYGDDLPIGSFDGSTTLQPHGIPTLTSLTNNNYMLRDLTGNVAEWVQDQRIISPGVSHRFLRGGNFTDDANAVLNSYRVGLSPGSVDGGIGFRVAQVLYEVPSIEGSPHEKLRHAFSQIGLEQVTSGILLETGSFFYAGLVMKYDVNRTDEAGSMSASDFRNAYSDLVISSLDGNDFNFPHTGELTEISHYLRDEASIGPITLALIDYTYIDPNAFSDGRIILYGEFFEQNDVPDPPIWKNGRFFGSMIQLPRIRGVTTSFILPSELLVNNTGMEISQIELEIAGHGPIYITPDIQFDINDLVLDEQGRIEYTLTVTLTSMLLKDSYHYTYSQGGSISKIGCKTNGCTGGCKNQICECDNLVTHCVNGCPGSCPGSYCGTHPDEPAYIDIVEPFVSEKLYNGGAGKVYVRIYPAPDTTFTMPTFKGLRNVVVVVDGFDPMNCRSFGDVWCAFGDTLEYLRTEKNYDLVVIDYADARDYIQCNGLALREVLKKIPDWMEAGLECKQAIILCGSMGTQVSRYALRTAELDGEDHHVGLFIAIDGPFQGSSIPIALQDGLELFSDLSKNEDVDDLWNGLNSHAAKQLLDFYDIKPEFPTYYGEMAAIGLPRKCRNIGISSGSGTGKRLDHPHTKGSVGTFGEAHFVGPPMVIIRFLGWSDTLIPYPKYTLEVVDSIGAHLEMYSDRPGKVFLADVETLGIQVWGRQRYLGNPYYYVDLSAGGLRSSGKELRNQFNEAKQDVLWGLFKIDILPPMTGNLDNHCYMPTYTALDMPKDLDWQPSLLCAPGQCENHETPFDNAWWEDKNVGHVCATPGSLDFVFSEMAKFEISRDLDKDGILDTCQCKKPPSDLLAWWPMENTGTLVVKDIASGNTGLRKPSLSIGPQPSPEGKVGGAFSFDGDNDYIHVINKNLNIDTGDFSIETWVKIPEEAAEEDIFQHMQYTELEGEIFEVQGYAFGVSRWGMYLGLAYDFHPLPSILRGDAGIGDDIWHHVAVTVDRDAIDGVKMFVDGKLVATYDATFFEGSLANNAPTYIGRAHRLDFSGLGWDSYFHGEIDELSIYKRALEPNEVKAIYQAGALGKCDEACYLRRSTTICPDDEQAEVPLTICNYSHNEHDYSYELQEIPAGEGCDSAGLSFQYPDGSTVVVPAHCCTDVHINIHPALSDWETTCYKGIVTNETGESFSSQGSLVNGAWWCPQVADMNWWQGESKAMAGSGSSSSACPGSSAVVSVTTGQIADLRFNVTNIADMNGMLRYKLLPISHDIDTPSTLVGLNGLPPGTAVEGMIEGLAIGETATISVNVEFTEHAPFNPQEVLLLIDEDDDMVWELAASVTVRSQTCGDSSYLYSIGDLNLNCFVDLTDFAMLASAWRSQSGDPEYNPDFDISIPPDDSIDWKDLAVLADNWLRGGLLP